MRGANRPQNLEMQAQRCNGDIAVRFENVCETDYPLKEIHRRSLDPTKVSLEVLQYLLTRGKEADLEWVTQRLTELLMLQADLPHDLSPVVGDSLCKLADNHAPTTTFLFGNNGAAILKKIKDFERTRCLEVRQEETCRAFSIASNPDTMPVSLSPWQQ